MTGRRRERAAHSPVDMRSTARAANPPAPASTATAAPERAEPGSNQSAVRGMFAGGAGASNAARTQRSPTRTPVQAEPHARATDTTQPIAADGEQVERDTRGQRTGAAGGADSSTHNGTASLPIVRVIVPDHTPDPGRDGMRKSEFLAALEADVANAAERELARDGRTVRDCPWIAYWFAYYEGRSTEHVVRALVRYAPEAAGAATAAQAIAAVRERVVQSVRASLALGRPVGVPEGIPVRAFNPNAPLPPPDGAPARDPILNQTGDAEPAPVRATLGLDAGHPLDSATRGRMESAFGADLSHVRVHSGARGQTAAGTLGARAFAYGNDVAFAPGQHRPGTPVGDALLAHELAHVLQQKPNNGNTGRANAEAPLLARSAPQRDLEDDADRMAGSALGAIAGHPAGPIAPQQKSSLAIARCGEDDLTTPKTVDVKVLRMFNSTRNPDPDIAFWNTNYQAQSKMQMQKVGDEAITEERTERIVGPNHKLEQSSCGLSDEEDRLRSHFASSSVLPAVYVQELVDIPSKQFVGKHIAETCGDRSVVVVEDVNDRQTLSHEAGHAMGLGHRETANNMMKSSSTESDTTLEQAQIRTIRSSSFAK